MLCRSKPSVMPASLSQFSSVQSLSPVRLFVTPWTAAHQASLFITNSQKLLKLLSIKSVMPSKHLIFCHPLLLPPSIFPSIRVFSNEQFFASSGQSSGVSASVLPMNSQGWFPLGWTGSISLQSKGLPRVFQHSSKASILRCSPFFILQLSHPYMTTGKTIALTRRTFVGKVMSLLFNKLWWLALSFLPRNKRLLISWLQSSFAVILEPKKIKSHCFHCFPIYLPWSDGTRCHGLSSLCLTVLIWSPCDWRKLVPCTPAEMFMKQVFLLHGGRWSRTLSKMFTCEIPFSWDVGIDLEVEVRVFIV